MNLQQRLAFYKSKIGQHGVKDWREVAKASHYWSKSPARAKYAAQWLCGAWGGSKRYISDTSAIGLRFVDYSDSIVRIGHTGWFVDNFQSETLRGAVWQLPARNGSPVFVYGYHDNDNEGGAFIDFDSTPSKEKAAYGGDGLAEVAAEEYRKGHAHDMAEQDIEAAKEAIHETNQAALSLIREIKQAGSFSPAICQALKAQLQIMLSERAEQFEIINERKANYWSAIE